MKESLERECIMEEDSTTTRSSKRLLQGADKEYEMAELSIRFE